MLTRRRVLSLAPAMLADRRLLPSAAAQTQTQLDVRVASFRGKRVQVTGEVLQPTPVPLTDVPVPSMAW